MVVLVLCLARLAAAQPSDGQLKKDVSGKNTISVKIMGPGTVALNEDTHNYEWTRTVEVVSKTEWPKIKSIMTLIAVYQRTGRGFQYWKTRFVDNRYDGIPNPTQADIDAVLATKPFDVYGGLVNTIVKIHEGPKLAAEPKWVWHTPNSVSFRVESKVDVVANNTEVETLLQKLEIRLYRDDIKGPWKNFMGSAAESTSLGKTKYSVDEIRAMPNLVTQRIQNEAKARAAARAAKLPSVTLPAFKDRLEVAQYLHRVLREGPRDKAEATLQALLAPGYFVGDTNALDSRGEQLVSGTLDSVFGDRTSYAQQYCGAAKVEIRRNVNRVYVVGVKPNLETTFDIVQTGGEYRDGVKVNQRWVIDEIRVVVARDADTIAWINSFSDRKKLCAND